MKQRSLRVIPNQPLRDAAGFFGGFARDVNEECSVQKPARIFFRKLAHLFFINSPDSFFINPRDSFSGSFAESRVTRARTAEPARTGEGKRTLFSP